MGDEMERRLTELETEHRFTVKALEKMSTKVDEMHTLLTKARGGWWLLLSLFTTCGFTAGSIVTGLKLFGPK